MSDDHTNMRTCCGQILLLTLYRSTELHTSHTGASPQIVRQIAEALAHGQLVHIAKYRFYAWVGEDFTSNKVE